MKEKNPKVNLFSTNCREVKENNIAIYAASNKTMSDIDETMSEIDDVTYHKSLESRSFRSSDSFGDNEYIRGHLI